MKHRVRIDINMPPDVSLEGSRRGSTDWLVLDLGSIIVHGFTLQDKNTSHQISGPREYYDLETLWMFKNNLDISYNLDEFSPDLFSFMDTSNSHINLDSIDFEEEVVKLK